MAILDRIKFDGLKRSNWLIYKYPNDAITYGSRLIVQQGQCALFVKDGNIIMAYDPGSYDLKSDNLPVLKRIVNLPFGGKTPFPAELYFINMSNRMDIRWGTSDPMALIDPIYHIHLDVRAFGMCSLKICDACYLFQELIGSMQAHEIIFYNKAQQFFKGIMNSKIKTHIANYILEEKISVLEISAKLENIAEGLLPQLQQEISKYGIDIQSFKIESINCPKEQLVCFNHIMEEKAAYELWGEEHYQRKRTFDVYEGMATNTNGIYSDVAQGVAGFAIGSAITQYTIPYGMHAKQPCKFCGLENELDSRFCSRCGRELNGMSK